MKELVYVCEFEVITESGDVAMSELPDSALRFIDSNRMFSAHPTEDGRTIFRGVISSGLFPDGTLIPASLHTELKETFSGLRIRSRWLRLEPGHWHVTIED